MGCSSLDNLLIDTWWYGLTHRLEDKAFENLARLRVAQGFSGIQLVAGIPPEVGPDHESAASPVGPAWTLDGQINSRYLSFACSRIAFLNKIGLRVVVYGAWGHQIAWLGRPRMTDWWLFLIEYLDDLDVIYCLTGELDLWIGEEAKLLPDRSTGDLRGRSLRQNRLARVLYRVSQGIAKRLSRRHIQRKELPLWAQRRHDWSEVLQSISKATQRPILVHTTPPITSYEAVSNPSLLAAHTVQTGHNVQMRHRLWQWPLEIRRKHPKRRYINLEPWYEGILGQFGTEDQLFAYWVSMLAGATSHCYGAHGLWNMGDGRFLAHWGRQTFAQAIALKTPEWLGLSHAVYLKYAKGVGVTSYEAQGRRLLRISKKTALGHVHFFPDMAQVPMDSVPAGQIWLPLQGRYVDQVPASGQVVVITRGRHQARKGTHPFSVETCPERKEGSSQCDLPAPVLQSASQALAFQ